jgi:hypothetical protein
VYQWVRLSFGDKPSPDLAINAINLLADRAQVEFPEAARILKDHTYVDDIAGSDASPEKVKEMTAGILMQFCPKASLPLKHGTVTAQRLIKIPTRIR